MCAGHDAVPNLHYVIVLEGDLRVTRKNIFYPIIMTSCSYLRDTFSFVYLVFFILPAAMPVLEIVPIRNFFPSFDIIP